MQLTTTKAKPFLKWAGGKTQLINQIIARLPEELRSGKIRRYVEPFVGGGALFFHIAQTFNIDELFISDVNEELILAYTTIKKDVNGLINALKAMERKYFSFSPSHQEEYFLYYSFPTQWTAT